MTTSAVPPLRKREIPLVELRKPAADGHLYAVLDACTVATVPMKARAMGEEKAVSLYRGSAEQDFWDVAPYLLKVEAEELDWIVDNASKDGWGILIATRASLETLRRHLRHFLKVFSPKGEIWFFRFYDPRVLPPFLEACSSSELHYLFGPILGYGTASSESKTAIFFQQTNPILWNPSSGAGFYSLMFKLTQTHVTALEPQAEADFVRRLCEHFREEKVAGTKALDNANLRRRIQLGLSRARRYGITWEYNLATFVKFMFIFAPNFDQHVLVQRILKDPGLHREQVIDVIVAELTEQEWKEIERDRDEAVWQESTSEALNA